MGGVAALSRLHRVTIEINGEQVTASIAARVNLIDFIRTEAGFTGSHLGCEHGVCGACTIEVDGAAVRGCLMLAVQADGANVVTVEGLAGMGRAKNLRAAFLAENALQCGYCTPGMLVSALEYIESGGSSDRATIRAHMAGNYCRCTGYQAIVDAIAAVIESGEGA